VLLAREKFGITGRVLSADAEVIPFTAQTRLSGVRIDGALIQKGAVDSVLEANPGVGDTPAAAELRRITDEIARSGGTPLAVVRDGGCSARSTSRTSSRRECANASPSFAGWASARS
jgi:K+-transporting ATPase ATPase B chain